MSSTDEKSTPKEAGSQLQPLLPSLALHQTQQLTWSDERLPTYHCSADWCARIFCSLEKLWRHEAMHARPGVSAASLEPSSAPSSSVTRNAQGMRPTAFSLKAPLGLGREKMPSGLPPAIQQPRIESRPNYDCAPPKLPVLPVERMMRPGERCKCSLCSGYNEDLGPAGGKRKRHICDKPSCVELFDFPSQLKKHARTMVHRNDGDEADDQARDVHDTPLRVAPESFRLKKSRLSGFEKETWKSLRLTVTAIMTGNTVAPYSWQEMCQAAERLCRLKTSGEHVFELLTEVLEYRAERCAQELLSEPMDDVSLLVRLNECWSAQRQRVSKIRDLFHTLDVTHQQPPVISPVISAGLQIFKKHVILNDSLATRTVDGLLMLIEKGRQGDTVDCTLLESVLQMLIDMQLYRKVFITRFIEATARFYAAEGQRLAQEYDEPEYTSLA